ncbi:Breast carcinoma-amplified sequence 3,Breast carcinoma-amplified sequence 3 homolog [Octopus vulgaris]|uniref:BCAS3 microtubule associated cell migration factor n=1 Tax=Octopus vulgaris TaxID=6645 RepID=A0AA36ANS0_OCTVU|nr:Breast carcinoma-amplified sequence 3,Breast carcinoma-amplified sequence 3 homolog [Octopus vulgaris]
MASLFHSPNRSGCTKYTGSSVRPQPYSDKTMMESVVNFISDVVPQAYGNAQKTDDREKVQWVRFEQCDANDFSRNPDFAHLDVKVGPLVIILGYTNGVQVWNLTTKGEAQEVMSIRQGPVRAVRILPTPVPVFEEVDSFASKRPLMVICDSSNSCQSYCSARLVSLKTGEECHSLSFKTLPIQNVECNARVVITVFAEKMAVFEACQFRQLFWITNCYPCPGPNINPIALGARWLAYADKRLVSVHQSCGGMSGDGSQSYAATVINAAKSITKGLTMFGEAMVSSVTGKSPTSHTTKKADPSFVIDNGLRPGIVSVIDTQTIRGEHFSVSEDSDCEGLMAHFHAHANEPVAAMAFDPTGTLLLTACKLGHNFHVFRLMTHPCGSSLGAVHHLYTLHRGDTTARVVDMAFSLDSRWVSVSTHRGTSHIFPVTSYGGPVSIRTHCNARVVNRMSRFHRSAGLDEIERTATGRHSPVLSGSPSATAGVQEIYPSFARQNALNNNFGNPRLPPYPHSIPIHALAQVKQPTPALSGITTTVTSPRSTNLGPQSGLAVVDQAVSVVACFASPRCCVGFTPPIPIERREGKKPFTSLYILGHEALLTEYVLEPRPKAAATDKISDDTPLELVVIGQFQWPLQRLKSSPELLAPLASNNPLISASTAVSTRQPSMQIDYAEPCQVTRHDSKDSLSSEQCNKEDTDEIWLPQVEMITHAGPHRRLWMGPQFSFKTYQNSHFTTVLSSNSSALLSQNPESQYCSEMSGEDLYDLQSLTIQPARSSPVAMPNTRPAYRRSSGCDNTMPTNRGSTSSPLLIEAGSFEQSPHLSDVYGYWTESELSRLPRGNTENSEEDDDRLREHIAEAMLESPHRDCGGPTSLREGGTFDKADVEDISTIGTVSSSPATMSQCDADDVYLTESV